MTLRTFADLVEQELSLTYLGRGGDLLLNWVRSGLLFLKTPLDVLSSLPQFAVGWKLGGGEVARTRRRTPHHCRLLTQRALLAHGVLVLEGVVRELRRVVRGRVAVAGSPVEGDCAVSCGRGGEKRHSVNRRTGTVGPSQNPRGAAPRAPSGSPPRRPPGLSAGSWTEAPQSV